MSTFTIFFTYTVVHNIDIGICKMKVKAETSAVLYANDYYLTTPYSAVVNLEGGVKQRKE